MMLVLTRKQGESVQTSNGLVVTVLSIRGKKVQLGFVAPSEVRIWRDDIRQKKNTPVESPSHVASEE